MTFARSCRAPPGVAVVEERCAAPGEEAVEQQREGDKFVGRSQRFAQRDEEAAPLPHIAAANLPRITTHIAGLASAMALGISSAAIYLGIASFSCHLQKLLRCLICRTNALMLLRFAVRANTPRTRRALSIVGSSNRIRRYE